MYGCLKNLRVFSMGNNKITGTLPASLGNLKNLQRIVLHQNKLTGRMIIIDIIFFVLYYSILYFYIGSVPPSYWELGCIVNLAGNPSLEHGPDVSKDERLALISIFNSTNGPRWTCNTGNINSN